MANTVPLATYIFSRLRQAGLRSIHGVPGDFFLRSLDYLPRSGLRWIGNSNELNAGYAADGYARIKGLGAALTTYGVGELCAINAIAGSYAESVPVIHLVGTPARKHWRNKACVHHTLGDGRYHVYAEMAKHITVAQADLKNVDDAAALFDNALQRSIRFRKPAYVQIPSDMFEQRVAAEPLNKPLNTNDSAEVDSPATEAEQKLIRDIIPRICAARQPCVIADGLSYQFGFQSAVNEIASLPGLISTSYTSGKGIIDESLKSWRGPLASQNGFLESVDLALLCGPLLADTNTFGIVPDPNITISFNLDSVNVRGEVYYVAGKRILEQLAVALKHTPPAKSAADTKKQSYEPIRYEPAKRGTIGQDAFWYRMSSVIKPHDTILLANGTPLTGGRELVLPHPCRVLPSSIWCSIGQMLPAAQGIALAKRDGQLPGRMILFEGDGSFQTTCQALSDIIRYKLDVTIFIINNAGYSYERWLHGMEAAYNDVPAWNYVQAPSFFGASALGDGNNDYPVYTRRVETWSDLESVLANPHVQEGKGLTLIDVVMDPADVPERSKASMIRASQALKSSN